MKGLLSFLAAGIQIPGDDFAKIIDALGKLPWPQACFYVGLGLIVLGCLSLGYNSVTGAADQRGLVSRAFTVCIIGAVITLSGIASILAYRLSPLPTTINKGAEDPFFGRQVHGTIKTVFTNSTGAMAVLLKLDSDDLDFLRVRRVEEYERKYNKRLSESFIGSRNINPDVRELLFTAYQSGKKVLITVNGLTPDGGWYAIEDAYIGEF
jgi:hypothetical protein